MKNYYTNDKLNADIENISEEINLKDIMLDINTKDLDSPYVVGIGASAGGLDAINSFFDNISSDTGLAFVIIQHLSPDHKSLMRELLSRHTTMKIHLAEHKMEIQSNSIYLIPPGKNMIMQDNKLYLLERDNAKSFSLPIDIFFHSLGKDKGNKAIAVILSGSGSDGSEGIKTIKSNGGLVIVQNDRTAQFTSMPQSALSTGSVDCVLAPSDMPLEITHHVKTILSGTEKSEDIVYEALSDEVYIKILNTIKEYTNIDFFHYKKGTVSRRIERRMSVYSMSSPIEYQNYINSNPHEIITLYKEFFIGVTNFFRDPEAFEIIEKEVLPKIFEKKSPGSPVRIWTAGCSTGEEAYTLAILLKEYMNKVDKTYTVKIFATDLDDDALSVASNGIYSNEIEDYVSAERLRNFFVKTGNNYQVTKSLRDMVIFAKHNLIQDPPFSKLDLVTCRNLLIYLQPQIQQNILSYFHFSLNQNGYLFLGGSETIGETGKHFNTLSSKWKIYSYNGEGKLSRISNFSMNKIGNYIHDKNASLLGHSSLRSINYTEKSIEKLIKQLQELYVPSGVIIDESYELVHVIGDVNNYLRIPSNKLSLNILKMIKSDLSIAVSTAVHNVLKENKELKYRNIRVKTVDSYSELTLTVKPFTDEAIQKKFVVILFEEQSIKSNIENEEDFEIHSKVYQRIADLEQELKYSNEHLQAVIEELESSNEELQATNEELLSSNEELQSTNEELQSVNEELYTVNSEYQLKIQEITDAHDDINNLLSITNVSTLFLDRNLCIRRFTPALKKEINIIDSDIGRPMSHISYNIKYDNLIEDVHTVLKSLIPIEKVVMGFEDNWYKVTIFPYLTGESMIKGIVINMRDITEIKNKDSQIKKLEDERNNLREKYMDQISELEEKIRLLTKE